MTHVQGTFARRHRSLCGEVDSEFGTSSGGHGRSGSVAEADVFRREPGEGTLDGDTLLDGDNRVRRGNSPCDPPCRLDTLNGLGPGPASPG